MRRLMTLGLVSAAALMTACSDDESGGGGNGGTATNGGSSGATNGGAAGNTAQGGTAGATNGGSSGATNGGSTNGGSGGSDNSGGSGSDPDAGDGGGGPPCTGCVELRVPVTIDAVGPDADPPAGVSSLFQFENLDVDFSDAVISFRVRALTLNDNFFVQFYSNDQNFSFNATGGFHSLNTGGGFPNADDFVTLTYDLSAVPAAPQIPVGDAGATQADPAAFDKSSVRQFGIEVGAFGSFVGTETVTVLVDSITIAGDDDEFADVLFTAGVDGLVRNQFAGSQAGTVTHHP